MQNTLIQNCDTYYEFFNSIREDSLISQKDDFSQSKIDSLTSLINENKTTDLLLKRGTAYLYLQKLKKAERDYSESLKIDDTNIKIMLLLGWTKEKQGNYHKAIKIYEKALALSNQQEIILFIELAKRKSKS